MRRAKLSACLVRKSKLSVCASLSLHAAQALSSWLRCLLPGGVAVVVLWPSSCETPPGPWAAYDQAVKRAAAGTAPAGTTAATSSDAAAAVPGSQPPRQQQQQQPPVPVGSWEAQLACAGRDVPGVVLVKDVLLAHEIRWSDAGACWQVTTRGLT